jgi:hypothetical protein
MRCCSKFKKCSLLNNFCSPFFSQRFRGCHCKGIKAEHERLSVQVRSQKNSGRL